MFYEANKNVETSSSILRYLYNESLIQAIGSLGDSDQKPYIKEIKLNNLFLVKGLTT